MFNDDFRFSAEHFVALINMNIDMFGLLNMDNKYKETYHIRSINDAEQEKYFKKARLYFKNMVKEYQNVNQ
jgi:hypothetical protein